MRALYDGLDETLERRAPRRLNARSRPRTCPSRSANLSSIWTVCYTQPSRYNWMLQYYLRADGLALSWVGTGRLIFSLDYTDADFEAVAERFVAAARAMQRRRLVVAPAGADQRGRSAGRSCCEMLIAQPLVRA